MFGYGQHKIELLCDRAQTWHGEGLSMWERGEKKGSTKGNSTILKFNRDRKLSLYIALACH